jgi:adenylate kinase family enzyme
MTEAPPGGWFCWVHREWEREHKRSLARRLGACHLSTGDVPRGSGTGRPEQTTALAMALESMRRGALVSDLVVSDIIRERIGCIGCRGGFILDGFPHYLAGEAAQSFCMRKNCR